MATADANVLAGATNGQDTKSEIEESAEEPERNIVEELVGKIVKEGGDSEKPVAIERTPDEL